MSNKIYPKNQKVFDEKTLDIHTASSLKRYNLDTSFTLINNIVNDLLDCYKLSLKEIEVVLNIIISKIREHKDYNRNDSISDLLAFLHSDIKDNSEIKKLKERETEDLLNLCVESRKKPICETKIYSNEKPYFASRSDLLGNLTKWWVNAVDNNYFKPKFK